MTPNMRTLITAAAMLAVAAWPRATTAASGSTGLLCGAYKDVVAYLEETYQETPAGRGLTVDGTMLELLVGPQGSWTITLTHPAGLSCLVYAGSDWEMTPGHRHEVVAPDAARGDALP
jgi:hypothetical protein